jgi:cation:H+ antiporter
MSAVGWFIMGIAALIGGAELVVHGGSRLAARLGVPPIVIGLTIVSIGTSTPELAVGIEAGLEGSGSLAVGNIAGAITFNLLFILGLSALLKPLAVSVRTIRFGLPTMIVVAVALMAMAWNGVLSRVEGAVLVGAALIYTVMIVRLTRRESRAVRAEFAREYGTPRDGRAPRDIVWNLGALAVGITVTVVGSEWLVDGAVELARMLGVSDAFIGLTVVTFGTSSPELVTTVVGTLRNTRDIAIGNLLGSSVYNILLILGVTCLVAPSGVHVGPDLTRVGLPVMTAVTVACVPVFVSGRRVTWLEGVLFVGGYVAYLTYLVLTRT